MELQFLLGLHGLGAQVPKRAWVHKSHSYLQIMQVCKGMTVRGATWVDPSLSPHGTSIVAPYPRQLGLGAQVPKWAWEHKSHSYLEIMPYDICTLQWIHVVELSPLQIDKTRVFHFHISTHSTSSKSNALYVLASSVFSSIIIVISIQ